MSLECSYKDIEWCNTSLYKSDDCICKGNLIVPDSMGDIAKIISVRACPSISDSKTDSGQINISGQVKFNVLYIGEDENTKICTLTTTVPFSHMINASGVTRDDLCIVCVDCFSSSHSIVNSRRLKVTSTVRFSASCYRNNRLKILSEAPNAQIKSNEISLTAARVIAQKNIVVTANTDLPAGKNAIDKILRQNARMADCDYKILNNKVIVKGNILVSLLYLSDDSISDATVTVPFTEVVEAEGLSPNLESKINITVADWEIRADTDLSGDYKMLDASIVLNVTILGYLKDSVNVVSDIYLPGCGVRTEKSMLKAHEIYTESHEEEFIKDTLTLPSESPIMFKIIDIDANLTDFSLSENTFNMTAEVTVLYLSEDSVSPVNTFSTKIPLTHLFKCPSPQLAKAALKHLGYAITGANNIEIRLGVDFIASCNQATDFSVFTLCEETEYTPEKRPSIVVSFVNKGESLWDIAKKYNIALSNLASANAIEENAILTVGEKLIIPR